MSIDDNVQRMREALIARMGGKSYLRPAGLIDALAKDTEESTITVRQSLARLVREQWIDGVSNDGVPFRQVKITGTLPEKPVDPGEQRWQTVLNRAAGLPPEDAAALSPLWKKLVEFDAAELDYLLTGLMTLRSNLAEEIGRHRFIVSAKYLIGSSKLLDELASPALRAFGISVDQFPSHPYYVVVAGCQAPAAVILVENPAALEVAMATEAASRCAFVATFGFGLGRAKEDYGNQLADIVEDQFANTVTLTREGSRCPPARELLTHPSITFWGDLDIAGIHIFLRLKKSIPTLHLSAIYSPMIASLNQPSRSHRYLAATGKSGQGRMPALCSVDEATASKVLKLCASRGVDQEQVLASEIAGLAGMPLDVATDFGMASGINK